MYLQTYFQREKMISFIKFCSSSLIAFGIDYVCTLLFSLFMSVEAANVLARIISATANFIINKKAVFKSNGSTLKEAIKYTALALVILAIDTLVLTDLFIDTLHFNLVIAKPVTETLIFCVNYPIQKLFVYGKKKAE